MKQCAGGGVAKCCAGVVYVLPLPVARLVISTPTDLAGACATREVEGKPFAASDWLSFSRKKSKSKLSCYNEV